LHKNGALGLSRISTNFWMLASPCCCAASRTSANTAGRPPEFADTPFFRSVCGGPPRGRPVAIQPSAIGIKTSRARYKVATITTEIKMALSVDDCEFTAPSSISTTNYHNLIAKNPARPLGGRRVRTGTSKKSDRYSLGRRLLITKPRKLISVDIRQGLIQWRSSALPLTLTRSHIGD
jgi:hypothetical protein